MTSSWEKLLHGEERKALKIQGTGRESEARAICQNFPSVSVCQGLCVCGGGAVCVWRGPCVCFRGRVCVSGAVCVFQGAVCRGVGRGSVWGQGPEVLVLSSGWKFSVLPGSYQKPLEGICHLTHKNRRLKWRMPKVVLQFPASSGPISSLPRSIKGTRS